MTLVRHYDAATAPRGLLRHVLPIVGYPGLVWHNRYMVQNFLRRDLLGRVHGSFLGIYWILLQPLFQFAIYFLVFGMFLGNWRWGEAPDPTLAIYLFSGVIVFHSLIEATTQCCQIVVDNGNLVKKVAFPSEVLPIHVGAVSLVLYCVGAVVCLPAGMLAGVLHPGWALLALPLVLVVQFVMTIGIGLLLANLYVFVRDTAQLWRLITMTWMFLSPVFWMPSQLAEKLPPWGMALLSHGNPAYPLIQAHRLVLGGVDPQLGSLWTHLGVAAGWAMAFLLVGYTTFMSSKHKYADII